MGVKACPKVEEGAGEVNRRWGVTIGKSVVEE